MKWNREESRKAKISNMSEEEKIWQKWCVKENKRKSRRSRSTADYEYERLANRQRKRDIRKFLDY